MGTIAVYPRRVGVPALRGSNANLAAIILQTELSLSKTPARLKSYTSRVRQAILFRPRPPSTSPQALPSPLVRLGSRFVGVTSTHPLGPLAQTNVSPKHVLSSSPAALIHASFARSPHICAWSPDTISS
ncbi:hypothetical protein LIA77_11371 [Sarocladium implicatum]|nr:hypothetical protein LIA77_11371 [Sarocladium implicatum]